MPFDSPELLSQAGYDSGDFVPLVAIGGANMLDSTSSNTYTNVGTEELNAHIIWDDIFPRTVQTQVYAIAVVDGRGDQIDWRVQSPASGETLLETTGITNGQVVASIGPQNFTPADPTAQVDPQHQIRNSDNATTVEFLDPLFVIGAEL